VTSGQVSSQPRNRGHSQCLIVIVQIEHRTEVDGAEVTLLLGFA